MESTGEKGEKAVPMDTDAAPDYVDESGLDESLLDEPIDSEEPYERASATTEQSNKTLTKKISTATRQVKYTSHSHRSYAQKTSRAG